MTAIRRRLIPVVLWALCVGSAAASDLPAGWSVAGSAPQDFDFLRDATASADGSVSALIAARPGIDSKGFGTLMQIISAENYRGGRWRLSGYLKTSNAARAQMWMRVDAADRQVVAFDNMDSRPVTGTTAWTRYEIILDVPQQGTDIAFGFLLVKAGKVWARDLKLERVDESVPLTSPPQTLGALPKEPVNLDFSAHGEAKSYDSRDVIVHDIYRLNDDHRVRFATVDQAEGQVPVEDDHRYNLCGMHVIAEAQEAGKETLQWDLMLSVIVENNERVARLAAGSFIQPPKSQRRIPRDPITALDLRVDNDPLSAAARLYGAPNADGGVIGTFPQPYAQKLFDAWDAGTGFTLELTYRSGARETLRARTRPGVKTANFFYHGSDAPVRRCLRELVPATRSGTENPLLELRHPQ